MIAGPNGAGKSTLAIRFGIDSRLPVINPDVIAKEMNPENPEASALQAGKEAIRRQRGYLANSQSFAVETTMSGKRELDLLRSAKDAGYKVNLVYCGVADPKDSLSRVSLRATMGGHNVPPADIIRRYERSMENLPEALKIADRTFVLDNSGAKHKLTMTMEHGVARFMTKDQPEWFKKACPDFPEK